MKNYLAAFLLLVLASGLHAQTSSEPRPLRLGLKIAPNLGWLKPTSQDLSKDGASLRPGFAFGLMADFTLVNSKNYFFSTGFELQNNGGKLKYADAINLGDTAWALGQTERTYKLQYISIPLAIKMKTNEIGRNYYYGVFGTALGFNINAQADDASSWVNANDLPISTEDIDIVDDITLPRAELLVGAGGEFLISGSTMLAVGVTWHNGFTNILNGRGLTPEEGTGNAQLVTDPADSNFGNPAEGAELKAQTNYFAIDIGIFF